MFSVYHGFILCIGLRSELNAIFLLFALLHIFSTVYDCECLNVFSPCEFRVLNLKLFGDTKMIISSSLILGVCAIPWFTV